MKSTHLLLLAIFSFALAPLAGAATLPADIPIAARAGVIYRASDLKNQITVPSTATATLDFSAAPVQLLSLTTNVTVTLANITPNKEMVAIFYNPLGTSNSITFNAGIVWCDTAVTGLASTKRVLVHFYATGTSNQTVIAIAHRQP